MQDRTAASPHIVTLVMAAAVGALAMNVFLPSLPGMARHFDSDYAVMQLAVSFYLAATAVLLRPDGTVHSTARMEDIAPLVPGQAERIRIPLLPISWVFAKGSRIRLSIAGADAEHCVQVPHGRPPRLTILRGGDRASALELPLRPVAGA